MVYQTLTHMGTEAALDALFLCCNSTLTNPCQALPAPSDLALQIPTQLCRVTAADIWHPTGQVRWGFIGEHCLQVEPMAVGEGQA